VFRREQTSLFVRSYAAVQDHECVWDPGIGATTKRRQTRNARQSDVGEKRGHEHSIHRRLGAAGPRWRGILLQTSRLTRSAAPACSWTSARAPSGSFEVVASTQFRVAARCVSNAIHAANSVSAASSESVRAAARTLDGTQSGNGTSLVTWRPELVWTSRTCERRPDGSRPAARTRAGHNRRWTNVTLPLRSRHTRTSSLARIARVTAKIS
jgi:hypothetical protein